MTAAYQLQKSKERDKVSGNYSIFFTKSVVAESVHISHLEVIS